MMLSDIDIPVTRQPLSWYVGKLERQEPFASLLYGDGEFLVALGTRTGELFTHYLERVTPSLVEEMRASLLVQDPGILRGTDPTLLNPHHYQGDDAEAIRKLVDGVPSLWGSTSIDWLDGTMWEDSVRAGALGPLLRALHGREVVVVGNRALGEAGFLHPQVFVEVPPTDAWRDIDRIERGCYGYPGRRATFVVCMGLGAIPLIMRLRLHMPEATYLDLGSVLDVFVGLGAERGWREELYADPPALQALVADNMHGVCGPDCGTYRVPSLVPGGSWWSRLGNVSPELSPRELVALRDANTRRALKS